MQGKQVIISQGEAGKLKPVHQAVATPKPFLALLRAMKLDSATMDKTGARRGSRSHPNSKPHSLCPQHELSSPQVSCRNEAPAPSRELDNADGETLKAQTFISVSTRLCYP